jgi:hypothetical protein
MPYPSDLSETRCIGIYEESDRPEPIGRDGIELALEIEVLRTALLSHRLLLPAPAAGRLAGLSLEGSR